MFINLTTRTSATRLPRFLVALLLTAAFAAAGHAQSNSATTGYTPSGLAPGAPSGSYTLSGFDNINPHNGGMNFSLPLLQVGGRGGAQYTMRLPIEQKWRATHEEICDPQTNQCWAFDTPDYNWWSGLPGYKAGVMVGRKTGSSPQTCDFNGSLSTTFTYTLTRLTFTTPDGTEYELRDQLYGGRPLTNSACSLNPPSRGTTFVTADGTSATFVSDTAIYDNLGGGENLYYPSGYLALRDGTRYRIDSGEVSWMRDRNGNKLTFASSIINNTYIETITDSLNRQITVEHGVTDVAPYGVCDRITVTGTGGAPRVIRVSGKLLADVLRTGYSLSTYGALFPELGHSSTHSYHNPSVVSAVWLPNGQSYKFYYNNYGELARVELPTGGAFEYDWAAGTTGGSASGVYLPMNPALFIYRRVVERRVYASGGTGSAYESKMTVSRPENYTSSWPYFTSQGYVEVKQFNSGGVFQAGTRHYYDSIPSETIMEGTNNPLGYTSWRDGKEWQTETLASDGVTALRRENRTWQQRAPISWYTGPAEDSPANDPRLTEVVTTLADSNQVSKQIFGYDQYNNQTDVYEYDFGSGGPGALLRHTHTDYLTAGYDTNTNVHIRNSPTSVRVNNASGGQVAQTEFRYDEGAYPLVWYGAVTGWADPGSARGNATTTRRWLDIAGTYLETHAQYDQVGNVRYSWDAKGNLSQLEYNDSFSDGNNSRGTFAYPTKLISPVPDPNNTGFGSNTSLTSQRVYDFSTGLLTSFTDPNGKTTGYEYNDPLDRPTKVNRPDAGWTSFAYNRNQYGEYVNTQTLQNVSGTVMSDYQFFDGLGRPNRSFRYENHDAAKPWLTADTQYDALGRAWRVSRQYRSAGSGSAINPSGRWTENAYDSLGRVTSVTTRPDNATATTSYSGNVVTVTDQTGKSRRSVTDALGRLTQAVEDPYGLAYATDYTYDTLGNLRRVNQGGQYRYFMYDSVGRLIRVQHPEQSAGAAVSNITDPVTGNGQWSLAYGYDQNGNLTARVDARGVTTTYGYDNLNRNTTVRYSDGTKDIDRHYDNPTAGKNGLGRFHYFNWEPANNTRFDTHLAIDEYDAVGRPKNYRQHFFTNGVLSSAFTVERTYDLAGNVLTQKYPSQRTVTYTYDAAGRLAGFTGDLGDGTQRTYASETRYHEMGGREQERFGTQTPLYNKHFFNSRGQMSNVRLSTYSITAPGQDGNWNRGAIVNHYSDQSWAGSGTDNNGNLLKQELYLPHDDAVSNYTQMAQHYAYDSLNRLQSVTEFFNNQTQNFKQSYSYDRFGNRTVDAATTTNAPAPQFEQDAANPAYREVAAPSNRLYAPGDGGRMPGQKWMGYDAAGNLVKDTYQGGQGGGGTRTYDAEGRMTSAQFVSGHSQDALYTYDADGRRVRRKIGTAEVWQVYGMDGELVAEYAAGAAPSAPQKEYGYRSGELLVTAEPSTAFSEAVWVEDSLPAGASAGGNDEGWNWVTSNPSPASGSASHQSNAVAGMHQHYFYGATATLAVGAGDKLFAYVYLDPANVPSEVMLQWNDGSWEHRAYWGANQIGWGVDGTESRRYMGPLPAAGQWVRLEVPASLVGLEGKTLNGMAFTLYGGRATWDKAGKATGGGASNIQWLVSDQLGTPRMVVDSTGSLSGVKRHDYLPFGEEIGANVGGRTPDRGYGSDNVRQQFTGYERDTETNLDFAQARYFASAQGRFTGVDPLHASASASNPQTWNRYSYGLNNPLRYNDPSGMNSNDIGTAEDQRRDRQPPPAPVIPPIDPSLAGAPVYQEQMAQGVPIPSGVVEGFAQRVTHMLGNNEGQCGQFLDGVTAQLIAPLAKITFQQALTDLVTVGNFSSNTSGDYQGQTTITGNGVLSVNLNFTKMTGAGTDSSAYVLIHETVHTVSPFADKLSNHYAMADAAYKVGRSMDLVPEAVQGPKPSRSPGDAADRYNSALFDRILYTACNPR